MSDKQIGALFAEIREIRLRLDTLERRDGNAAFLREINSRQRPAHAEFEFDDREKDAYAKIMKDNVQLTLDKWRLESALQKIEELVNGADGYSLFRIQEIVRGARR